jgi:hypothetical protein
MGTDDKRQPAIGKQREREAAERRERLATALRDNLRKRKQQARRRDGVAPRPADGDPDGA